MGSKSKENLFQMEGLESRNKKSRDNKVQSEEGRDRRPHAPFRSVTSLFSYFLENTTFHGLPRIFGAPFFLEKLFWVLAFLTCLGVFTYQGTKIVKDYISYPYSTRTDIITESSLDFPAVTICNVNMMRRSKLVDTRFEDLIELDGDATGDTDDYSFWFDQSFYERLGSENGNSNSSGTSGESDGTSSNSPETSSSPDDSQASGPQNLNGEFDFFESSWDDSSFDFSFYDTWEGITDENDWQAIYNQSQSPDFSDLRALLNPTQAELQEYGHQAEDFILQCSFDQRACSYRNFTTFQHSEYGNCFTFNGRTLEEPFNKTRRTGRTGANYGLQLTLFVEQPEHVGLLTAESGVKVSIHAQTEQPFPEDDGLTASTGQKTAIGVRKLNITRLGGLYGEECTKTGEGTNFSSETSSYTVNACLKQCLQDTLRKSCGCITDIRFGNYTQCSSLNPTQERCRQLVEYLYHSSNLECTCPISCSEESFRRTVSASLWPSTRYEVHLAKQLVSINSKIERIIADVEKTRQNVVNLVVFFEQLNYELNQQLAVYTVESLLGSVGGLLGLYLGLSFMSIGEIIVLLLGFLKIFGGKTLCSSCRSKSEADDKYSDRSKSQSTQKASDMNDYDEGTRRAPWYRSLVALATLFVFASMVVVVALVMLFELGVISINL
ncbi:amiloride-sensitive sodium channel subunit alpha [Strongylocentrotus purpuratus]|uniref:Uncharacterized protein n=1 Tax=Strongylocentrotus purpuratus TaxID=7668 RepID=A0A7M7PLZ2_STRPU|nr:amiloride-sensitive sodium channel subunit alpha [Strongylocentrotus purpuratus]